MTHGAGTTKSLWTNSEQPRLRSQLTENTRANVCVIGAGISGLTTAYRLACEGQSVVVIDSDDIGSGETGRTTAHLSSALDDRYLELEQLHGAGGASVAAQSHAAAIEEIQRIVRTEKIACEFERLDGFLFVAPGDEPGILDRELAATHRAGLPDVRIVPHASFNFFDTGRCLLFPNQAQFHPLKYLSGLAEAIERRSGKIFTRTHAVRIQPGPPTVVTTADGKTITSSAIVVATNSPVNDIVTMHTKQAAYRTYVVGFRIPRGSLTRALYWDTSDPYHYVRIEAGPNSDILIVGGEDHKTGQSHVGDPFEHLVRWTRDRFPMAGEVAYAWSGQVMEPIDGMAFIGRNPGDDDIYIVTGDSGNGMTHGTLAGMLLTDLILKRPNPWAELYNPARVTLAAMKNFAEENINVAAQYASFLTPGDVNSAADLLPGTGAIIRHGLSKVAVYKDSSGVAHELEAACPHLGCIVAWNTTEKTWDCPCHGSRFSAMGEVINGPALIGLCPVKA